MKLTVADEHALIPELQTWNSGAGIPLDDWARCVAAPEQMVAASRLFWPELVEHDGCVLAAAGFTVAGYDAWLAATHGDRASVEGVMNHRHLVDLFNDPAPPLSHAQALYLGRVMASMLRAKLAMEFPTRRFEVTFPDVPQADLIDYVLTFSQATP